MNVPLGETERQYKVILNKYRAGNATEQYLMQDLFDEMQEKINKEQKAEVYFAIQSDAEVNLAKFEDVAHDPVYEPDPDSNTACTANEDAGECKSGSTNSNIRKKHREMRDVFELTKSKKERAEDNKVLGAGLVQLIPDQPQDPAVPLSPSKRKTIEAKVKAIQEATDPQVRKQKIKDLKQATSSRGCCHSKDNPTQRAIAKYIQSANMLDVENHKEKARNALERSNFLSDSEKEILQDFLKENEDPQTEEEKKNREQAKKKAEAKLKDVKEQRNRRGYNFGSKLVNKLKFKGTGTGGGNSMNPAKKPKHYRRSFARTFRSSSTTSKINGLANGLNAVLQSVDKFKSGEPLEIASATMDIIGSIAAFAGPYGQAFSAVLGVVNIFMGMFGKKGPTQIEVMTNLINDQTELLVGKIDDQTEILIETMKALNDATVNSIVTSIEQDSWRDMINEMKGATNSLKTKKIHLEEYRFSCILGWIEIALESDMQHITRSLGRVSSFMTWYCYSRKNIPFCGEMVFQYVMLSNLRNAARAETINIVSNSDIHNARNKLNGLLAEYRTVLDLDKQLLKNVLQSYDQENPEWKLLCFATCAFNKVKDEFENDNLEGSPDMELEKSQKKFILQYMSKIGLKDNFNEVDRSTEMCKTCYKDTPCKPGFERGPVSKKCEKPRKLKERKTDQVDHNSWTKALANIPFSCGTTEALTQFRLKQINGRLRFIYTCGTSHDLGPIKRSKPYSTRMSSYDGYLYNLRFFRFDGYPKACRNNEVIAGIKFKHNEDDGWKLGLEFDCATVPYKLKCTDGKSTGCKDNGRSTHGFFSPNGNRGYVEYMDRHNFDCGDEGFLRGFKYEPCGSLYDTKYIRYDRMKFTYSCCYLDKS